MPDESKREPSRKVTALRCSVGGIAVVEKVNDEHVHAVLWSREMVRIRRTAVIWDTNNLRWETGVSRVLCKRPRFVFGDGVPGKGAVSLPRLISVEVGCTFIAEFSPGLASVPATES